MGNLVLAAVLLAVLLKTVLNLEGGVTHVAPPEPLLPGDLSVVPSLSRVTEQDAVLAAHMLHLGWQALEILLASVALLCREYFQNMIFAWSLM